MYLLEVFVVLNVEIIVKGCIDEHWSEWFEDLTINHLESEQSLLTGSVVDQSALYSLISRLSRLGLELISVQAVKQPPSNISGVEKVSHED